MVSPADAARGGWEDPPGGWAFIEEWHQIPPLDYDPSVSPWNHNNDSDAYSHNAHTDAIGEEVVRIDVVEGAGDTEDGETAAEDATALTIVDIGDPRDPPLSVGADPSDRKIYFLAPLHEPEFDVIPLDPLEQGVTFIARFRIVPMPLDKAVSDEALPEQDPITFIPESSDRAQVGLGFVDPAATAFNALIGVGYFTEGTLSLLTHDAADPDGDENVPIAAGIDTTEFHSVWVNAITDPADFNTIHVKAYIDGGSTPVEAQLTRGGTDAPAPEDLQDDANPDWAGIPELSINLGSAGTPSVGILQYDYVAATFAGAFDPVQTTRVHAWELY
jgi:hypothetical protein